MNTARQSDKIMSSRDRHAGKEHTIMQGWSLIRRFFLMSLGLIGLMAVALGWATSSYLTQSMLEREKMVTVDYVKRVVRECLASVKLYTPVSQADREALRQAGEKLELLPEVVRIKVYDPEGTVIWSDDRNLIGKNFQDDGLVRKSLRGQVLVMLEQRHTTPEHRFEYPHYDKLTSIYVPIFDEKSGRMLAVFELYKLPVLLNTSIRQGRRMLWAIALVGGALVLLGQFGLVRSAARTINTQYDELRQRAEALEKANRRLRDTQDQLLAAERLAAIGEVTAGVAHGIRNPLGTIRLDAQMARMNLHPGHANRKPVDNIIAQVDMLDARLRSFLNTTKPFEPFLQPIPPSVLVANALEGIRQRLEEQEATALVAINVGQASLHCDAVKIEEALQELLVNSIDAGAHTIRVVGQQRVDHTQTAWLRLDIEDNGHGLHPRAAERVFHPFYTSKPLGTGLGLVMAKKIVEAHGGRLILEACELGGARATMWLPFLPPPALA